MWLAHIYSNNTLVVLSLNGYYYHQLRSNLVCIIFGHYAIIA